MQNRIPEIRKNNGRRILIICEGDEEYDYLTTIKELNVWSPEYSIKLKNAKGISNIFPIYQYGYQNGNYNIVLIFCDT